MFQILQFKNHLKKETKKLKNEKMMQIKIFLFAILFYIILQHSKAFAKILRLSNGERFGEFSVFKNSSRISPTFTVFENTTFHQCIVKCWMYNGCESVNVKLDGSTCELSKNEAGNGIIVHAEGWMHVETNAHSLYQGRICEELNPCIDYDYCVAISTSPWYECKCKNVTNGKGCKTNPCQNKGQCLQSCSHTYYTCNCTSSYFGKNCEIHEAESNHFKTQHLNHAKKEITVNNTDSLTACLWFNPERITGSWQTLFTLIPDGKTYCDSFSIYIKKDVIGLYIQQDVGYTFSYSFAEYKWHHICISWKYLSTKYLYINEIGNNILVYHQQTKSEETVSANNIVLGQDTDKVGVSCKVNSNSNGFLGKVARLNIWGKELNGSEVQQVYEGKYSKGDIVSWDMFV